MKALTVVRRASGANPRGISMQELTLQAQAALMSKRWGWTNVTLRLSLSP